jgi:hypothetical protein
MSRGILLFAFNTDSVDYFKMAIATAKRAEHFLGLKSSVVTDINTDIAKYDYKFDNVFIVDSDKSNKKNKTVWINKGRYQAYDLTPYDETLLLDTDYLINSDSLNLLFNICTDYVVPNNIKFLMENIENELISPISYPTMWATIIVFKKTNKTKQLFECIKMIQHNYRYYAELYGMYSLMYRNDYALTIAHRIINGHLDDPECHMPWNLVHVDKELKIERVGQELYNTEYKIYREKIHKEKIKKNYIIVKDMDFHCLNKQNFMEIA